MGRWPLRRLDAAEKRYGTPDQIRGLNVRVVTLDGDPWFVARDVAIVLGMAQRRVGGTHTSQLVRTLAADEEGQYQIRTPGGLQKSYVISESGLYKIIMRSDKPEARAFQDWVTREVLPAIRKDGAYVAGEEKVRTGELSEGGS